MTSKKANQHVYIKIYKYVSLHKTRIYEFSANLNELSIMGGIYAVEGTP